MKKKNILLLAIAIFAIACTWRNTTPLYLGFIISCFLMFIFGTYASMIYSAISSILVSVSGLALKYFCPVIPTFTNDKDFSKLNKFMENLNQYKDFISKYFLIMILCSVSITILGTLSRKKLRDIKMPTFTTNSITQMALFVSISVIINTLRIDSISFGGFPIILSGYLLGPINGFIVGGLSDIVGFIVRPSKYGFNPIFVLTSALTGAIPIMLTTLLKGKYPNYSYIKTIIGVATGQFITSVLMVPYFQSILYAKNTFLYYFIQSGIKQIISVPIYTFLIIILVERLSKVIKFKNNTL